MWTILYILWTSTQNVKSVTDKYCYEICINVTWVQQWRCCPCLQVGLLCSASLKCRSAAQVLPLMAGCCQLVWGCGHGRESVWIQAASEGEEKFGSQSSQWRGDGESMTISHTQHNTQLSHIAVTVPFPPGCKKLESLTEHVLLHVLFYNTVRRNSEEFQSFLSIPLDWDCERPKGHVTQQHSNDRSQQNHKWKQHWLHVDFRWQLVDTPMHNSESQRERTTKSKE